MEIDKIPIAEIIPYENNPRKNDKAVDVVAKSIREFGFRWPIMLDKDNRIIAGHTRLKAAIKLGLQEVPVIWAEDLTEEQTKAFRIMDNKSHEYAQWDFPLLVEEFKGLKEVNFDLSLTGFSQRELDALINPEDMEGDLPDLNKPKYQIVNGEIYQLGKHRLLCGDSTNKDNVNKLFNGVQPTLMVTDPPYGVNYNPSWRNETNLTNGIKRPTRAEGKVSNDNIVDWSLAYELFPGDIAYVWHAGVHTSEVQESLSKAGFNIASQIIWAKPHFILSRGDYHWKHEPCWYAVRKGKQHNWQGSRNETTIWEIAGMNAFGKSKDEADIQTGHGTQKPIECMARPIKNNTSIGQAIYDPFGGSGTTLIAAEQTGRACYMMELSELYCSVIIERWENLTGQKATKLNNDKEELKQVDESL